MKSFSGLIDYNTKIFNVSYHDLIIQINNKMRTKYDSKKEIKYGKYSFDTIGAILNDVIKIVSDNPSFLVKYNKNEFTENDASYFINIIHNTQRENFLYWYNNEIYPPFKKFRPININFVRACTISPYGLDDDILQLYADYVRCILDIIIELQLSNSLNSCGF